MQEKDVSEADIFTELVVNFIYYMMCLAFRCSMGFVTVSAKVRRELWEKLKSYGVNISEVIRRSLEEEAIMRAIITLIKFMQVIELQDAIEVLRISNEVEIIFYDAAYVVTALRRGLILVTDDRRLAARIERYRDMILKEYGGELHVIRSTEL